jgi:hypothetical protein
MAHRGISLPRVNQVAFGAKRTPARVYEYAALGRGLMSGSHNRTDAS